MGQIVVLDQNMINMIAAGEVIERPASIVKELTENSIDAGATKITVSIEDGGRKLISVADNGCGMDAEDLARAFESHTTSKIKRSCDLRGISTLGFRGEALASIASVAQVRAVSRPRLKDERRETRDEERNTPPASNEQGCHPRESGDAIRPLPATSRGVIPAKAGTQYENGGSCIEIDCGIKGELSPCSADYGTTIQVRDLFYKLPARRKFLRTANTEAGHVIEHFTRIALANESLDMVLYHNGRELHRLSGKDDLRRRIAELFSSEIGENLIETESSEKGLHISALLGKPCISRTNSKFQYIFLNGRHIRDRFISHAIKEAYRSSLEPNRYPVIFLFLQMPYEDYDVNVHPMKSEVRFYNANLVHSQILGCLREKLLAANLDVSAKLPPTTDSARLQRGQKIADAMAEFFKKHRPIQTQQQLGFRSKIADSRGSSRTAPTAEPYTPSAIQIHDSFIVAEDDDGFIIIDQHALHERIIYEDLRRRIRTSKLESQKLLIPESFELTDAQADVLKANAELIERLGIELAPFGPRTMAIQAFPTLLAKAAPLDFVGDLIDLLTEKGEALDAESLLEEVLNMAACKAAVKAGQSLSGREIEQLLTDRQTVENQSRCPHGRPTTIKFSQTELEKQFKRT